MNDSEKPAPSAAEEHAEREHAKRSSSQLGNLALCEGYTPKPTKKVHWVTAQGNRGHAALDSGDDEVLESDFEQRMKDLCESYSNQLPPAFEQLEEIKVHTIDGRWGYTDRLRLRTKDSFEDPSGNRHARVADLLDWKFVKAKVVADAEVNLQGKDYVVGIFEDDRFPLLETIHVHFVMPRFQSVTVGTFHRSDVPRLKLEIFSILRRARRTDNPFYKGETLTPHYDACKYCGRSGNCVALRRIADTLARAYDPTGYGRLPALPEETHASRVKDPGARAQLQLLASLMGEWSKSVQHHNLTASLENPENLPAGYELDWRKGKRSVTSAPGLMLAAREFGLSVDDLLDSASITWGRLEQALKDNAPRGKKKDVVEAFHQRLLELEAVERPEPTPTLRKCAPTAPSSPSEEAQQ